jgi:hypothetical protein
MRMAGSVLVLGFLTCSAATADEAIEKSCALAAASRLASISGATITALRVLDPPRLFGVAVDANSRTLEIDVHTPSVDATYVYICKAEPSERVALEMIGIR